MWAYKYYGKSWNAIYNKEHPPGFRWLHESFGTNWRMTEMQATIGRIQLTRMRSWTESRQGYAKLLDDAASSFDLLRLVAVPEYSEHAEYKHYMFIKPDLLADGWDRDRMVNEIVAAGVPCFQGSCSEVYLEKAFDNTPWRPEKRLPNAVELGETSLMFLVHPTLTQAEIAKTAQVMKEVFGLATK
jgi:dTDP-4-amino-4,6-dideoxygalactose transaminase